MPALSVVIVTHDSRDAVARTLPVLDAQLEEDDELIVVDNASADGTPGTVGELAPSARVIESGANVGFAAGCNRGAAAASGDLLVFLNPDAVPAPGFRAGIVAPLEDGRGWSAWQGLVTAAGGRVINTRGGEVHFTGIAWAGGAGAAVPPGTDGVVGGIRDGRPSAPGSGSAEPPAPAAEPAFASGACLAIPRQAFLDQGGFAEEFFLYHEDVDLSFRLRLAGGSIGVEPAARVDHDYEFAKGPSKWRHLERNRWATVIRTYPAGLLALTAPALLLTELALLPIAIAGGWLGQKLLAWADTVRWLPRLARERRSIQATRRVRAREFAAPLTADLGSAYLGAAGRSRILRALLRSYWSAVLALLGAGSSSPDAG